MEKNQTGRYIWSINFNIYKQMQYSECEFHFYFKINTVKYELSGYWICIAVPIGRSHPSSIILLHGWVDYKKVGEEYTCVWPPSPWNIYGKLINDDTDWSERYTCTYTRSEIRCRNRRGRGHRSISLNYLSWKFHGCLFNKFMHQKRFLFFPLLFFSVDGKIGISQCSSTFRQC